MGFKKAENSVGAVVIQAQKFGFTEVWMVVVIVIGLPNTSPFRDANQIPLQNDLHIEFQANDQFEDIVEEEGGGGTTPT